MIYCIVPEELASSLLAGLRDHFADGSPVEVVVERRCGDRRARAERRTRDVACSGADRRRVLSGRGRRVAERRGLTATAALPSLPSAARRYADRLVFVESIRRAPGAQEDVEASRLIAAFQAGDAAAFEELYRRYFDRVYAYLMVALRDRATVEDLVQEVFTRVFTALPRYGLDSSRPFRVWLFTITRNAVIDERRRAQRLHPWDPDDIACRRDSFRDDVEADVAAALHWVTDPELLLFVERLPPKQLQILVLTYLLDMSTAEIASATGSTTDAVFQMRSRALRTLGSRLSSVGRGVAASGRAGSYALFRQAPVLRTRRFALSGY